MNPGSGTQLPEAHCAPDVHRSPSIRGLPQLSTSGSQVTQREPSLAQTVPGTHSIAQQMRSPSRPPRSQCSVLQSELRRQRAPSGTVKSVAAQAMPSQGTAAKNPRSPVNPRRRGRSRARSRSLMGQECLTDREASCTRLQVSVGMAGVRAPRVIAARGAELLRGVEARRARRVHAAPSVLRRPIARTAPGSSQSIA